MSWDDSNKYLKALASKIEQLEALLAEFNQARTKHRLKVHWLEGQLEKAKDELGAYLLADIDEAEEVVALESRLHLTGFVGRWEKLNEDIETSFTEKEALEANDEFQNLEFYLDQATTERDDVVTGLAGAQTKWDIWCGSRWHDELKERKYFDPGYIPRGWWARVLDWRAVSLLMSHVEKERKYAGFDVRFANPKELKALYLEEKEEFEIMSQLFQTAEARVEALEGLRDRHAELVAAPDTLHQQFLEACTQEIVDHIETSSRSTRLEITNDDKFLRMFFNKIDGLTHQVGYLKELLVVRFDKQIDNLEREHKKAVAKKAKLQAKLNRGKSKYFTQEQIKKAGTVKRAKIEKRIGKADKVATRVGDFHKYEKGSFLEDFLWWDLMTRGAPGDDLYRVRVFHQENPNWDYKLYEAPWDSTQADTPQDDFASAMDDAADALAAQTMASADDADDWGDVS